MVTLLNEVKMVDDCPCSFSNKETRQDKTGDKRVLIFGGFFSFQNSNLRGQVFLRVFPLTPPKLPSGMYEQR